MRKGMKNALTQHKPKKPLQSQPHENWSEKKERMKNTCTVSARMRQVVDQMILFDHEQHQGALQQTTIFAFKSHQSEIISCFLQEMRRENLSLYQNKQALLQLISDAHDHAQTLLTF